MRYRLQGLKLPLEYKPGDIQRRAAWKMGCALDSISNMIIIKRSLDARKEPKFNIVLEFDVDETKLQRKLKSAVPAPDEKVITFTKSGPKPTFRKRPVVIGAGPAGLLAALSLAQSGARPILYERGADSQTRKQHVSQFWETGTHLTESNVLYGEGGAGLFSDGKLTARTKDKASLKFVLQSLVNHGADSSILYDSAPHIGTDQLLSIVPGIRKEIIEAGGEIFFNSRLESISIEKGKVTGVRVNGNEIETDVCLLATGHSARDVYKMLADNGVPLEQKSFAVGVRVELPQSVIDNTQWGRWAGHKKLHAASFRITRKREEDTGACYSFCMCPGGVVIPCVTEEKMLTTNGMSYSDRGKPFGNAAFLVPIMPQDYKNFEDNKYPALAGCYFQEEIERKAYIAGGKKYGLPAARISDFINRKDSGILPEKCSFSNIRAADLHDILPEYVSRTLVHTIPPMLQIFHGLNLNDVVVYGAETRSSSPVRIIRDDQFQSVGICGLYPCGEGAGYAGGIVSSAIDGLNAAQAVLKEVPIQILI